MAAILIVEDDLTLNQTLKSKLEIAGYQVSSATNGQDGLRVLNLNPIDLILVDIMMPQMDGIEMLYHWGQKQVKKIPTIILTNMTETSFPETVSKVLIKSNVSIKEIIEEINRELRYSRSLVE